MNAKIVVVAKNVKLNFKFNHNKIKVMIQEATITEGNLQAVKSTSDFGGPNMWSLCVKNKNGFYDSVQWMSVYRIQEFFKTKLPVYKEVDKKPNYELA